MRKPQKIFKTNPGKKNFKNRDLLESTIMRIIKNNSNVLQGHCVEAAKLSENYEKFILTAVDFEQGKDGNLTDQMKASLK